MPDEPSSPSSSPAESAEARLARLDALASDLFDGEPISAEEALVRLHQEVMQAIGATPAPKATPEPEPIQLPADAFEGFEGMEWMDDVRVWRGALLALVGGRTQELLEQWGEEYHAEALRAGGGDSAWFDNLSAPLQARWIALVRERQIMRRAQAHHDRRRAAQRRSDAALFGEEASAEPTGAEAEVLRLTAEIRGALDLIPNAYRVWVYPKEGGPQDLAASLAVSVQRMVHALEGAPPAPDPAPDMSLLQGSLGIPYPFPLPEQPREGGTQALGGPRSPGPGTLAVNTDPPDLSTIGLRARWAREVSGLSMGQAAREFGMSVAALSAYEVGNLDLDGDSPSAAARLIPIPDDLLGRMADTYGVRLSFLRTGHLAELSAEDQAGLTKLTPKDADSLARFLGAVGSDTP